MEEIEFNLMVDDNNTYFKKYLNLIKSTVDKEAVEYKVEEKRVRGIMAEENDKRILEEGEDHLGWLGLEMWQTEQLMYKSFIVSIFIFMEAKITSLCVYAEEHFKQVFSHKDLAGNGVTKSIKYIERVFGESFIADPSVKFKFEVAQKIRNALVHNEGVIKDEDKSKIKEFMKKYPGILDTSSKGGINITYKYANEMISLNKYLCKEISKKWKVKW